MDEQENVEAMVDSLAEGLSARLNAYGRTAPLMIGIRTGGVWVAGALHRRLALEEPLGELNINFYRDDFTRIGLHPRVQPSNLPFEIDGRHVILVDDVLHTGRTVRAALNEIFDYGRPASVMLVTLVDRGARELPIQADLVGKHLELVPGEQVKLLGPDPLRLEVQRTP